MPYNVIHVFWFKQHDAVFSDEKNDALHVCKAADMQVLARIKSDLAPAQ